jgi:hypothetical protein
MPGGWHAEEGVDMRVRWHVAEERDAGGEGGMCVDGKGCCMGRMLSKGMLI